MKVLLIGLIRGYQVVLSPWVGGQCRHWPTCSEYAREAIGRYGAARGSWLALRRVLRCNPWHPGGIDPVPEQFHWR
jgi:putative membrane protein insertion efficiency factor